MGEGLFAAMRAAAPEGARPFMHATDGSVVTYSGMFARSGRIAHHLWHTGLRPGDRLVAQVEKSSEALLLYLACLRTGAVYVPVNPACTPAEMEYLLGDAEPACSVVSPDREHALKPFARGSALLTLAADGQSGTLVDSVQHSDAAFSDVARAADDLAAILYTSGTTGRSKGAMLTQRNLLSNACTLRDLWRFTSRDVLLHPLPIYHTHGLFTATNTILMAGASMILLPKFDLDQVFRQLPHATSMMGVPTFYTRLLADSRTTRAATSHMRLFVSGSAPLLPETHGAWFACTGHAILERYGMTETNMIASNPYEGERIAGTVGFPLPDIEVRISDPADGVTRDAGRIGIIEVRGPNVFKGYWRKPEQTAQSFCNDGFFVTGDLGVTDSKGYLSIVGRAKDLVISGGFNVYPREVELEIDALPGVVESAIIGVPHRDLGEGVTAVVVREAGARIAETEILAALGTRLARYKIPRRIVFCEVLPRNAMGKVQKNLLRERYAELFLPEAGLHESVTEAS